MRGDSALSTLPAQLRIEMANNLMPVQIEVERLILASVMRTSEYILVEVSGFGDVSNLYDYLNFGDLHVGLQR
jgi:hypothetical protein